MYEKIVITVFDRYHCVKPVEENLIKLLNSFTNSLRTQLTCWEFAVVWESPSLTEAEKRVWPDLT